MRGEQAAPAQKPIRKAIAARIRARLDCREELIYPGPARFLFLKETLRAIFRDCQFDWPSDCRDGYRAVSDRDEFATETDR